MNKLKLVRFNVDKKYLWASRAIMFLAATPFLWDIFQATTTGVVQDGRIIANYVNDETTFFLVILKKLAFSLLFIWFCTGGIVANKEEADLEKEESRDNN
jgi:hypothetical protein